VQALGTDVGDVPLTYPPGPELGDLATPVCFELARLTRQPPRQLAAAIVEAFEPFGAVERVTVAGGGYINAFLDRGLLLRRALLGEVPGDRGAGGPKRIVEHTNINPNKAAHIGHLRNAVLGDTLVRCLRVLGHPVEVQNYIDDTGVQVADLVVGFQVLRGEGLGEVRERYSEDRLRASGQRLDYIAWDLYAEVTRFYEQDLSRLSHRAVTLRAMEQGRNPTAELAAYLSHRMVQHHLETLHRIGVRYDLLPRESDILALRFWDHAFERLKASGALIQEREGKNAGCWVIDVPGVEQGAGEDQKVIVRSDGTVTYVGKDIAYQLWKFGLLGRDFRYRPFEWSPRRALYVLWSSTSDGGHEGHPPFGRGGVVYNVIDTRQSYLQRVVALALRSLGYEQEAERSIHFAYEMVALTPRAARQMFPELPLSDDDLARPYLEMSGRRGLGVRADDLIDALVARAEGEVAQRNPDMPREVVQDTARRIAVGALRYYMLRFARNRVVAFDLDAALAFEGETGPYLQYSVVRARNILGKTAERHGAEETDPEFLSRHADLGSLGADALADHWGLVLQQMRTRPIVEQAVETLELAGIAKHAYVTAQSFNTFYHRYPVAQEADPVVRHTRAAIVRLYHERMAWLLDLMGIEVPERM
jgi:arginyl-tRNA synthetase